MNALDSQRALLDSLMGAHRNNDGEKPVEKKHWRDDDVCKYYLCGFCPHHLFVNTKSDLGPCEKEVHSEQLRRDFQNQKTSRKEKYERRFLTFLQDIIYLLERKIQRGRVRISLDKTTDSDNEENLTAPQRDRLEEIDTLIEDYTEKMEDLGNEGRVEEAQELLMKVETLKKEKIGIQNSTASILDLQRIQEGKKMTVCEVCGAFLVVNDAEIRVDAHLRGRTHQGFQMIRDKIDEILEKQEERRKRSRSRSKSRSRSRRHKKKKRKWSSNDDV